MEGANQCRVYLNDRTGHFFDATFTHLPWAVIGCAQQISLADLDADGDLDVVIAMGGVCGPKQENVVLVNDGRGHLTPIVLSGIRRWSMACAIGDVDGNGLPDLFFANANDPSELWLNFGGGQFFDASSRVPFNALSRVACAMLDVNGDGRNDLVTASQTLNGSLLEVLINTGIGFVSRPDLIQQPIPMIAVYLQPADMDGDGDIDLVVAGNTTYPDALYGLKICLSTYRHDLPTAPPAIGRNWTILLQARPNQLVFPVISPAA